MRMFDIKGMSCAACQARIEKAVSSVPGVSSCSVNLLANVMSVDGTVPDEAIVRAVENAGYGASVRTGSAGFAPNPEIPALKRRFAVSLALLLALMAVMFFLHGTIIPGICQMALALAVMAVNRKFFVSGTRGALHGAPNMDTLVSLGSAASFCRSVWALAMSDYANLYFDSAAMILTLITLGKLLEAKSKGRTADALRSLARLFPETAVLDTDAGEVTVRADRVKVGDVFVVRPGERMPADGVVTDGSAAVDESALTGESVPVDKAAGSRVSAATMNMSGFLKCRAVGVGEDTVFSQVIRLVTDASATKAPIAKTADKVAAVFVPAVLVIAAVTFAVWLSLGESAGFAIARAVSVLVISCPCALGLATPVAITVGSGVAARHGILFKTAESIEETGRAEIVVLDKTGTVTEGRPEVVGTVAFGGADEKRLMEVAFALESKSEHPLAKAVVREAERRGIRLIEADGFLEIPGKGLAATLGSRRVRGGSEKFVRAETAFAGELPEAARKMSESGRTGLFFAEEGRILGMIAVADAVRSDSRKAVEDLNGMGILPVMLTGDNVRSAGTVAADVGVSDIIAGVLPAGKEIAVRRIREFGKTVMVGDGINDAPALASADVGMAVANGTDVAADAADVVLMKDGLRHVVAAIRISRAVLRNVRENLFWAFFYNVVCIPLAAGCWSAFTGWQLSPALAAAAMSLSSFCVVTNALRLNLLDPCSGNRFTRRRKRPVGLDLASVAAEAEAVGAYGVLAAGEDALHVAEAEIMAIKAAEDGVSAAAKANAGAMRGKAESARDGILEVKVMKKTIKVRGMMCGHCEARVKKALEAIDGVKEAMADHTAGTVAVVLSKAVEDSALKSAVEAQDYEVLGIESVE